MNLRTSSVTDGDLKTLRKIPINDDFSCREGEPYLYGPLKTIEWQVRVHENGTTKTICHCSDAKEAANIVLLLKRQKGSI